MRNICIQAGHWGLQTGATGAPMEQTRNMETAKRLSNLLVKNTSARLFIDDGFTNNDDVVNNTDWDLYLALHCDMDYAGNEGGGFADWIDPSIDSSPQSNAESKRIMEAIESVYFKDSGIRNMPSRRNANTKFYYMWNNLSANTHCVILEMGESIDAHDRVILEDYDRQAQILYTAILKAFPDLKPVTPPQPPVDLCASIKSELEALKKEHAKCGEFNTTISSLQQQVLTLTRERNEAVNALKDVTDMKNRLLEKIDKAKVALT